jgi:hypothetical protein
MAIEASTIPAMAPPASPLLPVAPFIPVGDITVGLLGVGLLMRLGCTRGILNVGKGTTGANAVGLTTAAGGTVMGAELVRLSSLLGREGNTGDDGADGAIADGRPVTDGLVVTNGITLVGATIMLGCGV